MSLGVVQPQPVSGAANGELQALHTLVTARLPLLGIPMRRSSSSCIAASRQGRRVRCRKSIPLRCASPCFSRALLPIQLHAGSMQWLRLTDTDCRSCRSCRSCSRRSTSLRKKATFTTPAPALGKRAWLRGPAAAEA